MPSSPSVSSFETDASLNSSEPSQTKPTDSDIVLGNERLHWNKITSLLTLFERFGCLYKHDERYVLAGRPTSAEWESCMSAAASVEVIELEPQGKKEALQILPATYIRLVQQLKGKPLFPKLKVLRIEDYHGLVDYLPLFLSSALQTIELVDARPDAPIFSGMLKVTLCDFVEWSPGLQSLSITQVAAIPKSMLGDISLLYNLCTLKLSLLSGVRDFEDFRPLAPLALESLTLKFFCSSYICRPDLATSSSDFLASLDKLHISGLPIAITDFLRSLGSQRLICLNVEAQVSTDTFSSNHRRHETKQKNKKKSTKTPRLTVVENQEMTIVSSRNESVDLGHLTGLRRLEQLQLRVAGWTTVRLQSAFEPPSVVWDHLDTLSLAPTTTVTFSLLSLITLFAPRLKKLDVAIDVNEAPSEEVEQVFAHGLKLLSIRVPSLQHLTLGLCRSISERSETLIDNLPHFIRISRHLDALFPTLQKLIAVEKTKAWEVVWQLVELCQTSRANKKCEGPGQAQDEFEVVETGATTTI